MERVLSQRDFFLEFVKTRCIIYMSAKYLVLKLYLYKLIQPFSILHDDSMNYLIQGAIISNLIKRI